MRNAAFALLFMLPGASAHAESLTLVALGDSLTAGYGLPADKGLVPQLQAWLAAEGQDVMVANAGVSGDTTAGGLARLDWSLTPDADALMVILGGNDMLRGIDPAVSRANLSAILQGAADRHLPVLLVSMSAPGNFGPDYKATFDAIFPDLAAQFGVDLAMDFFAPLKARGDFSALMQVDGIHPNAEGVRLIAATLGPQVIDLLKKAGK